MAARCDWCLDYFDAAQHRRTEQELGQIKSKLFIADNAVPTICPTCFNTVMSAPLLGLTPGLQGNRTLLG